MLHLVDGQHPRQHHAADAEQIAHQVDRFVIGGRTLHRHMQAQVRMALAGIGHQRRIGHNHRVHAQRRGGIDGAVPALHFAGLGKGVDRHQHMAAALAGVGDAGGGGFHIEIQAGEIARVGCVFQAEVNGVGTVIDGGFHCGEIAGGAHQLGDASHFVCSFFCFQTMRLRFSACPNAAGAYSKIKRRRRRPKGRFA